MSNTISRADLTQIDRLVDIYYAAHDPVRGLDSYPDNHRRQCEPKRRVILNTYFDENHYDLFVVRSEKDSEKIEGYMACRKENGWWHVEELYTEPSTDRPGARLMRHMQDRARENKIAFVTLDAVRIQGSEDYYSSFEFYRKFGFALHGGNHMRWDVA